MSSKTPVLGFCAAGSGTGKTTLLTQLIPLLNARGLRISVIKHAHHSFDIDQPHKDSYRLREAGALQMLVGSNQRWALITELSRITDRNVEQDIPLAELLMQLDHSLIDLILVEGFKDEAIAKIEIYRPSFNQQLVANEDQQVIAVATDGHAETALPLLNLNNPAEIAEFVLAWLNKIQLAE